MSFICRTYSWARSQNGTDPSELRNKAIVLKPSHWSTSSYSIQLRDVRCRGNHPHFRILEPLGCLSTREDPLLVSLQRRQPSEVVPIMVVTLDCLGTPQSIRLGLHWIAKRFVTHWVSEVHHIARPIIARSVEEGMYITTHHLSSISLSRFLDM